MDNSLLRKIPKIDLLLSLPALAELRRRFPYELIRETAQDHVGKIRASVLEGTAKDVPPLEEIAADIIKKLDRKDMFSLKRVINATGVVLHTNLGRAPLGREIAMHVAEAAAGYCNLEYDLENGARGSRYSHVEKLLRDVTGAEAAMVVNNNAGAVFLMLNTLAKGKKTAVSRGELVEIGGSFRVPQIMAQSGAELVEVGTTNKTHPQDYAEAIGNGASVLLKVHTSNFRIEGFAEAVDIRQLARMAKPGGVLVLCDLGSGFLFPSENLGLHDVGHTAGKCLKDGADVVCFSGDKLLGSAQAGIIIGRKDLIDKLKKNHLSRMLRVDKLTLAALEMTLLYSKDPSMAKERVPALNMLAKTERDCQDAAKKLQSLIKNAAPQVETKVLPVLDEAGGGSLPGVTLPGAALSIKIKGFTPRELERRLRARTVPVIARISRDEVLISARTLCPGDLEETAAALLSIAGSIAGAGK